MRFKLCNLIIIVLNSFFNTNIVLLLKKVESIARITQNRFMTFKIWVKLTLKFSFSIFSSSTWSNLNNCDQILLLIIFLIGKSDNPDDILLITLHDPIIWWIVLYSSSLLILLKFPFSGELSKSLIVVLYFRWIVVSLHFQYSISKHASFQKSEKKKRLEIAEIIHQKCAYKKKLLFF